MKLEDLDGVGPKRAKRLREAGIGSVEKLASLEPQQVSDAAGVSVAVAQKLVVRARNSASADGSIPTWKILLVVLLGGLALYAAVQWSAAPTTYEYNGFTFTETQCAQDRECWSALVNLNIGAREVPFFYRPDQVEDVPVDPSAVERILSLTRSRNSSVTIVFDEGASGEVGVAASNLARVTGERVYNISTSGSVYGQPVTCEHASALHAVVYLTHGDLDGVTTRGGCVLIVADDPEELLRVTEAYRLHLLRIMR